MSAKPAQSNGVTTRPESPVAPPPIPPEVLIDWEALTRLTAALNRYGSGAERLIAQLLEHEIALQLDTIEAAAGRADGPEVRRASHRLRGGCLQLGALGLVERCLSLEQAEPERYGALVAELRACYRRTIEEFHRAR